MRLIRLGSVGCRGFARSFARTGNIGCSTPILPHFKRSSALAFGVFTNIRQYGFLQAG